MVHKVVCLWSSFRSVKWGSSNRLYYTVTFAIGIALVHQSEHTASALQGMHQKAEKCKEGLLKWVGSFTTMAGMLSAAHAERPASFFTSILTSRNSMISNTWWCKSSDFSWYFSITKSYTSSYLLSICWPHKSRFNTTWMHFGKLALFQ